MSGAASEGMKMRPLSQHIMSRANLRSRLPPSLPVFTSTGGGPLFCSSPYPLPALLRRTAMAGGREDPDWVRRLKLESTVPLLDVEDCPGGWASPAGDDFQVRGPHYLADKLKVYEYIIDRHHIHMNSTKWTTLTEFVKYLGRMGKLKVEETPKGWFITYIDREPEALLREGLKKRREKAEIADEERQEKVITEQIERASKLSKPEMVVSEDETKGILDRESGSGKVAFALQKAFSIGDMPESGKGNGKCALASVFIEEEGDDRPAKAKGKVAGKAEAMTALEELMREQERVKEKINRKDYWLCEGLVVKVMSKSLEDKGYYKKKGVVRKVIGTYVGEIKMIESEVALKVDQEELETVIPQIGGLVRIVNGAYRGFWAQYAFLILIQPVQLIWSFQMAFQMMKL